MSRYLMERLPDLLAAAATLGLGLFAWVESSDYAMGTLRSMDAGYFPRMISVGLLSLGLLLAVMTLLGGPNRFGGDRVSPLSMVIISAALLTFAFTIERFGIIPAIFCSVLLSTFASETRNYVQALLLSAGTAVLSALVFVQLLGLTIKVFAI